MYENVIYNKQMFYRDKLYDYKKFCERIALVKSRYSNIPINEYPFLRMRQKKHEMEKEKQKEIDYTKDLLLKKYQYMYKHHNLYHPSKLKFQPHPSSLKLSKCTPKYYDLYHNNKYMGNKLKEVQSKIGYYNCAKSLGHYKKLKYLRDELLKRSKFNNNILLHLVTPDIYEKRINQILTDRSQGKIKIYKNIMNNDKNVYLNTNRCKTPKYNIRIDNCNYIE